MTRIMQLSLASEALMSILSGAACFFYPYELIALLLQTRAEYIHTSAITLVQFIGLSSIAQTYLLLAAVPNSPGVFYKRKLVFETLTAGGIASLGLLLWYSTKDEEVTGFPPQVMLLTAIETVPMVAWHMAVLWVWPSLMKEKETDYTLIEAAKKC